MTFKKLTAGVLAAALTLTAGIMPGKIGKIMPLDTELTADAYGSDMPGISGIDSVVSYGTTEATVEFYIHNYDAETVFMKLKAEEPLKIKEVSGVSDFSVSDSGIWQCNFGPRKGGSIVTAVTLEIDENAAPGKYTLKNIDSSFKGEEYKFGHTYDSAYLTILEPEQELYNYMGIDYIINGDTASVYRCDRDAETVDIQKEVNGAVVDTIDKCAFKLCTGLTSVEIPDTVKTIDSGAFSGCTALESVTVPDSVQNIGGGAFKDCQNLKSIEIPSTLETIEKDTFRGCESIEEIVVPRSVSVIKEAAFAGCANLKSLTIENPGCSISADLTVSNIIGDFDEFGPTQVEYSGVIRGYSDSAAQAYAEKYNYSFEKLDGSDDSVYSYESSTAQEYAEKYGYRFEAEDENAPVETKPVTAPSETETTAPVTESTEPSEITTIPITETTTTTAATTTTNTPEAGTPVKGDLSGNNRLDMRDAIEILKYMMGKRTLTAAEREIADYNGDKKINMTDVIAIAKYLIQQASNK